MRHSERYEFRLPFVMTREKLAAIKRWQARGMSLTRTAELTGVSRKTVTAWLRGKRRFIEEVEAQQIPAARGATWRKEDGHAQGELQAKG